MERSAPPARVRVWALPVRLAHWGLAALVAADLLLDDGGPLHRQLGYAAAALVLARLAWGAWCSGLKSLLPSWRATRAYLRAGAPRHLRHDPLGLWMVWLLWLLVLLLAVTGWMSRLEAKAQREVMPHLKGIWKDYENDDRFWIHPLPQRAVPGQSVAEIRP